MAQAHLRASVASGRKYRPGPSRSRPIGRPTGSHPLRKRSRTFSADARRPTRGNLDSAYFPGLFARLARFRQAAPHARPAQARPSLRFEWRTLRSRPRKSSRRPPQKSWSPPRRRRTDQELYSPNSQPPRQPQPSKPRTKKSSQTPSQKSSSPPAPPACPKALSIRTACFAAINK